MDFLAKLLDSPSYVFGYILDGKGGGTPLSEADSIRNPAWLHLDYSGDDCAQILQQAGLSEAAIDSLTRTDTRPRSLSFEHGRILILRGVNMNPGASPEDMVSIRFWLERDRLISLRQRRILSAQDMRDDIAGGKGPGDIPYLLFGIIELLANRIADYVESLDDALDSCEESIDTADPIEIRKQVIEVRRHAAAVRRYLAPQRDALESFSRQVRDQVSEAHMMYLHEQVDRIVRYVEDLDLIKEKAILLQDELLNRVAQEQNARMYVLSIVAAIFLPISFVTGIFGMNVAGLPGVENPGGFLLVALFMAAVAAGILFWLKYRKWL